MNIDRIFSNQGRAVCSPLQWRELTFSPCHTTKFDLGKFEFQNAPDLTCARDGTYRAAATGLARALVPWLSGQVEGDFTESGEIPCAIEHYTATWLRCFSRPLQANHSDLKYRMCARTTRML